MEEILKEFGAESTNLIAQLNEILEQLEENATQSGLFEEFGQVVDRMMGTASTLSIDFDPGHPLHTIAKYCELCKIISYKSSQITNQPQLLTVVVALLLDATETLEKLVTAAVNQSQESLQDLVTKTFLERLHWIAGRFDKNLRATVGSTPAPAASPAPTAPAATGTPSSGEATEERSLDFVLEQLGLK